MNESLKKNYETLSHLNEGDKTRTCGIKLVMGNMFTPELIWAF